MKRIIKIEDADGNVIRRKVVITEFGESKAQAQFQKDTDIRNMFQKHGRDLNGRRPEEAFYGDVSEVVNYHEMAIKVAKAEQSFDKMPWEIRKRFDNDPQKLIDFVSDEKNREEAVELGLVEKRPEEVEPEPQKVQIVNNMTENSNKEEPVKEKPEV